MHNETDTLTALAILAGIGLVCGLTTAWVKWRDWRFRLNNEIHTQATICE